MFGQRRALIACFAFFAATGPAWAQQSGAQTPLRVVLIPADGGTEDGTLQDYRPVFNAVSRQTGLRFDLRVGQSYNAVVEAMCSGAADIAFQGPVTFVQASRRGCAELLAVGVERGQSIYYAGLFTRANSPVRTIGDMRGRSAAFGDVNSTSSFVFPMAMIMDGGLNPARDLAAIRLTGSHANSLAALVQGQVDVAALSFESYERAVREGAVDPNTIRVLARSAPIPYPPITMRPGLAPAIKQRLREAFATAHQAPGVTPDMIRGYGGARLDRYDTTFDPDQFAIAGEMMARLDQAMRAAILEKASER